MELGALVIAANGETNAALPGLGLWTPSLPVFGKTVLNRWVERVEGLGIGLVSVDHDGREPNGIGTVMKWAQEGVERILLIVLGSYAEVDLSDVIRFHHEGHNQVTKVFDQEGPLGISLLDRDPILKNNGQVFPDRQSMASRYDFRGYVNRLSSTVSYRKLVEDALQGRCGIQPAGLQIGENIWIHETAEIGGSVQIQGPCYIGPGTHIKAGVAIKECSSIEHNCEIDVGTTLDRATVLPCTYVAAGLHIHASVIDGTRLEDLTRGITVDLGPAGLASRVRGPAEPFLGSSVLHPNPSSSRTEDRSPRSSSQQTNLKATEAMDLQ